MDKKILLLATLAMISMQVFAQYGDISGTVVEDETGDPIIGATIMLDGTGIGTLTDFDGFYEIRNVEEGTYTLNCSYISFEKTTIPNVVVSSGGITTIDFKLKEEEFELEDVEIVSKKVKNTSKAVIAMQKNASVTLNGISADQIRKSGDNDVASAMKRVTGVTVEGGKYVYVRGLGDRYSKTLLNGAEIPSLDPNRNTVQMDIFPSNLIDNLIVYKTFSPDLPGSFTGGLVNIETKDFPETFNLQFSTSFGYRPRANLNNSYLDYEGGNLDGLGFDDGTRDVPAEASNIPSYSLDLSESEAGQLTDATRAFKNNLDFSNQSQFLNHSHSFSIGNQKKLFGKPIGYNFGLTYRRDFNSYDDGETGRYLLSGNVDKVSGLNKQLQLRDARSEENVLWGAMFNTSYMISNNSQVSFTAMRNQNGIKTSRYQEGRKPSDDVDLYYQTRSWLYDQRSLSFFQLEGDHTIPGLGATRIEWKSSYTISEQDQPDLRFFTNGYRIFGSDTVYKIEPSIGQLPTRYFRDMKETSFDNKLDVSIPFAQSKLKDAQFKVGGAYIMKERTFNENQYRYSTQTTDFSGDVQGYLDNVWTASNPEGVFITDAFDPANNYDADQQVGAAYMMIDMPVIPRLRVVAGARYEYTDISLTSLDENLPAANLENHDILPAINLNYSLSDKMSLRTSYTRTLARPTFREIAPFASFEFIGDFVLIGDESLQRTLVDNIDARWEWYPDYGEMISFSLFYKNFQNHIERAFNPIAANPELNYRNVESAFLVGSEFEVKKNLSFISEKMKNFSFGANVTYVFSRADIDSMELSLIRATDPQASAQREMFGQSPFAVNALFSYQNEKGTSANLSFNVMGKRLSYIIVGGTPNVYERPRPLLGLNVSQELGKGFTVRASANNILNSATRFTQTFKDQEYVYQAFNNGPSFSVGISFKIQ